MAFVYEEVGKENEALWNEIGWRDWAERKEMTVLRCTTAIRIRLHK